MKVDTKIIDFTNSDANSDYVVMALMPTFKGDKQTTYVHFGMNDKTNKEEFCLENEFEGCCVFDKSNANGIAKQMKAVFLNAEVFVQEVEYVKKKKKYKIVNSEKQEILN